MFTRPSDAVRIISLISALACPRRAGPRLGSSHGSTCTGDQEVVRFGHIQPTRGHEQWPFATEITGCTASAWASFWRSSLRSSHLRSRTTFTRSCWYLPDGRPDGFRAQSRDTFIRHHASGPDRSRHPGNGSEGERSASTLGLERRTCSVYGRIRSRDDLALRSGSGSGRQRA